MEKNTKIAIGLAAAVVVGYIVYKSKKASVNTKDQYLCPLGFKLTPYPMGRLTTEICKDSKGNIGEKQQNPNWDGRLLVGTNQSDCICESYPCNCGGESDGYMPTEEEILRLEADRRNIGNWDLSGIPFEYPISLSKPERESRPYTQEEEEKMMRIIQNTNPNSYAGY